MYDEYPNFKKTSQKVVTNQHFKKIYIKVSEDYFTKMRRHSISQIIVESRKD